MSSLHLVAVTRRLDTEVDLIDVAGDGGVVWLEGRSGFGGRGEALRIGVPRHDPATAAKAVHSALDQIEVDDAVGLPGTGPVAFGALPFSIDVEGSLVVPEIVVGRAGDGTRWITAVTPEGSEPELPPATPSPSPEPRHYAVAAERAAEDWCRSVADARDELGSSGARKVVLSRAVVVEADREIARRDVLTSLRRSYPSCMIYSADGYVGASPELLVARAGDLVRSHPMAGTAPRSSDASTDARLAAALMASTKDLEEHRLTIDMVHDTLLPWCSYLDEEAEPSIVAMANVQHLATMVEGRLSSPPASVVELMTALHPTPAVGGAPRAAALALIERHEQLDRGRFAGPVGWVDAHGNGSWAVGIRCAHIDGTRARLFAGVGVLPDSDPATELAETRAKLQALLGAILRP
jgi:isochorismate synthase